ncbi:MAG: pantoate--beta-alanine ligase [Clostridium sp.]
MEIISNINGVREYVNQWKRDELKIGFVPTMGYLHEGHCSLIEKARRENDKVVVSIFVNPTQFGKNEDLDKYPRDLQGDSKLCNEYGVDLIFNPTQVEMYSDDATTYISVSELTEGLCGKSRPTHFNGVCTVVAKLFNIVKCDRAYFGEKDAQQLATVKRMVRDLNIDVEVIGCPIIREDDGLAKSSRNVYLNDNERISARILSRSLKSADIMLQAGERNAVKIVEEIKRIIESEVLAKIDYIEVVDSITMKPLNMIKGDCLIAIAVFFGKTRLIDNFTFYSTEEM